LLQIIASSIEEKLYLNHSNMIINSTTFRINFDQLQLKFMLSFAVTIIDFE